MLQRVTASGDLSYAPDPIDLLASKHKRHLLGHPPRQVVHVELHRRHLVERGRFNRFHLDRGLETGWS
jgi:hypothetical protein